MLATGIALAAVLLLVAYLRARNVTQRVQGLLVLVAGLLTGILIFQLALFLIGD